MVSGWAASVFLLLILLRGNLYKVSHTFEVYASMSFLNYWNMWSHCHSQDKNYFHHLLGCISLLNTPGPLISSFLQCILFSVKLKLEVIIFISVIFYIQSCNIYFFNVYFSPCLAILRFIHILSVVADHSFFKIKIYIHVESHAVVINNAVSKLCV